MGKKILHYEIRDSLGHGGMGIVYKAYDPRLLRWVAIKLLSPHLVAEEKNLQRFLHEAQAASALNHPNICTVYDIGHFGATHYIVMEYIDGQTLGEMLRQKGPLPEKVAAKLCVQICDALAATHAKGIIHRDIKPDNIMVTRDGYVKIMDFGLAKITHKEKQTNPNKDTPLPSAAVTEQVKTSSTGVEGTVLYMSPEQVEHGTIDERTDMFSLGVILYELLTGIPPFRGKDSLSLMSSILDDVPRAPSSVRPHISKAMDSIVLQALAKSPGARFQSVAVMGRELSRILDPAKRMSKKVIYSAITIGMLGMSLLVARLFLATKDQTHTLPKIKVQGLSLTTDSDVWPVFSPSGQQIAYVSTKIDSDTFTQNLKIKDLNSGRTQTIYEKSSLDTKPLLYGLDWSGKARWIAVHQDAGGICLVDTSETSGVVKLTEFGYTPRWSPDGRRIVFSKRTPFLVWEDNEVWLFDFADSTLRRLSPNNRLSYDSPAWSPNGHWIICIGGVGSGRALWLLNAATGKANELKKLGDDIASPIWSPSGQYIYFKTSINGMAGLYRVKVDLPSARLTAQPELVIADAKFGRFNISPDGKRIIYQSGNELEELWRIPFGQNLEDAWREAELITTHTQLTTNLAISPDGRMLALETFYGSQRALALFDPVHGNQRLLYDAQSAYAPSWSPDGRWILFDAGGGNNSDIWRIPASGGRAEKIIEHAGADWMPTYAPDGKAICFLSNRSGQFELWITSTDSGTVSQITESPGSESGGYWSHDSQWIAYFRNSVAENSAEVLLYDVVNQTEHAVFRFPARKMDILAKIVWDEDDANLYFYDEKGFAQLHLQSGQLSYPLDLGKYPHNYIRYTVHGDQLYLIKRQIESESIWMAEGLE